MDFRVDGQAVATNARQAHEQDAASTHSHTHSHTHSTVDINELKRRVERRDNENKRKDREISLLQKEILTLTKDIHGLRERNDLLQHSLTNARLLTATSREEAETRITNNIIVDLENKLARCEKSNTEVMGDNEVHKITIAGLQNQLQSAVGDVTAKEDEVVSLKEELYTANLKLKTLQIRLNEKDVEMEETVKELEDTKRTARSLKGEIEHKKTLLNTNERNIAELTSELKRAQASLLVKNETNSLLRNQVTDMGDKTLNVTHDEVAKFKKIEMDNRSLENRNKELLKSVELHMDLLHRAEAENKALLLARDQAVDDNKTLKETIFLNSQNQTTSATTFASLKKEVVKLRKENRNFSEKIDAFLAKERDGNTMAETDPNRLRVGLTNVTRNHQEATEGKSEERKRRKVAEEAAKALRNRISFLLEQMDQASKLSATWKEQKSLLKAEISSLHQTNYELRERLLNVQRNFMDKTLYEFANPSHRRHAKTAFLTEHGDHSSSVMNNDETAERILSSGYPGHESSINQAEVAFNGVAARPLPTTVEGLVERQLFDAVCAYSTGDRSLFDMDNTTKKPKKKIELKDTFIPKMREDGIVHVAIERNRDSSDITRKTDADELLTGLQIPAFLKFVQTRHPDKIPYMFTEKIASILNFFRSTVQDYLSQLGESRMVGAKLQSKIANSAERVKSMQHMYSLERISKQKNLMKFIREQLRLSDFRRVIDKISKVGRDSLDEIELQRKELLAASQPSVNQSLPDNNRIRSLMVQLMQVAEQLSATSLYNGQDDLATNNDDVPVGSLELRIPDSQVDDETLHGVVGLLVGALGSSGTQDDSIHPSEGVNRADAFRQSDVNMGAGLGVDLSGARLSAATQIAKTFLTVQSNYSDRILLLNLKDNLLSDISCKILSGLVEKTKSLRMLDLRGNMISPVGAKMLFDATRRNQSVLYVTQRQHGFMVEGHREIMGSVQDRDAKNSHDERKLQDDNDNDDEFPGGGDPNSAKSAVRNMKKRQPLRIDMRNNNPEQEAIEKLLESNEYTSRTGVREKYHNDLVGGDSQRRPKSSSGRMDGHQPPQKPRPVSAANTRMAGAGMARSYGNSDNQALSRSSSNTDRGSHNMFQSLTSERRTQPEKPRAQLLPQVGDSDDSDEEAGPLPGERIPPDPSKMSEIERRLAAKENERIIGIRTRDGGAGVGSLLDKEIRGMQEQHGNQRGEHQSDERRKVVSSKKPSSKLSNRRLNDGGLRRPQSASAATRSNRPRPASASGVRKSQSAKRVNSLNKSSSDGSVLKKKQAGGTTSRTPQKGMSSTLSSTTKSTAGNNSSNNAYFHLNPAVLF